MGRGLKMGYRQILKTKIIRIKHEVTIEDGCSAWLLKGYLADVPDDAKIEEISYEGETLEIVFTEEKEKEDE